MAIFPKKGKSVYLKDLNQNHGAPEWYLEEEVNHFLFQARQDHPVPQRNINNCLDPTTCQPFVITIALPCLFLLIICPFDSLIMTSATTFSTMPILYIHPYFCSKHSLFFIHSIFTLLLTKPSHTKTNQLMFQCDTELSVLKYHI